MKLLDILQDMQQKGHEHVQLEITETKDSHIVTIHPVEKDKKSKENPGDVESFDKDLID